MFDVDTKDLVIIGVTVTTGVGAILGVVARMVKPSLPRPQCQAPDVVERHQREAERRDERMVIAMEQLGSKIGELGTTLKLAQQEATLRAEGTMEVLKGLTSRLERLAERQAEIERVRLGQRNFLEMNRMTGTGEP